MRIAFTPLIVLAAFIIGLAIPAQAHQACTQDEANKAEQSADNLTEWSQVYDSFRRYGHCDDGSIAEGYDDSIAGLLVNRWHSVGELSKLSAAHPAFWKFVLAHINTLMSPDQAKAIAKNANQDCPVQAKTICAELEAKVTSEGRFAGCQQEAASFLANPTQQTFASLVGTDEARCWPVFASSNPDLQRLTNAVQEGNPWAAQYLAANLRRLDGGNLEDALIAMGQFSDHNMEKLLIFASKGQLSKHELTDAVTMLPLSLSDDSGTLLDALRARKDLIKRVNLADLEEQKTVAIKAIDDSISQITVATPPALLKTGAH